MEESLKIAIWLDHNREWCTGKTISDVFRRASTEAGIVGLNEWHVRARVAALKIEVKKIAYPTRRVVLDQEDALLLASILFAVANHAEQRFALRFDRHRLSALISRLKQPPEQQQLAVERSNGADANH
jgi:hypothetical protein